MQPVLPGPAAGRAGARWFRCDLAEIDLGTGGVVNRTGSLRGALAGAAPLALRCFQPSVRGDRVNAMKPVSCDRRHAAEFAGLWTAPDVPLDRLDDGDRTAAGCRSVIADFAALPDDGDLRYRVGYLAFAPTREEWDLGVRAVRCFLWLQGEAMTGSYRGAGPGRLPINYG